jgi:hypothetical protein
MNAAAVAWALRQRVQCAPTKLMLAALACRYEPGLPIRASRELYDEIAQVAEIRRAGVVQRLRQLEQRGLLHFAADGAEIHLHAGRG